MPSQVTDLSSCLSKVVGPSALEYIALAYWCDLAMILSSRDMTWISIYYLKLQFLGTMLVLIHSTLLKMQGSWICNHILSQKYTSFFIIVQMSGCQYILYIFYALSTAPSSMGHTIPVSVRYAILYHIDTQYAVFYHTDTQYRYYNRMVLEQGWVLRWRPFDQFDVLLHFNLKDDDNFPMSFWLVDVV